MEAAEVRSRHMASEVRVVAFGIDDDDLLACTDHRLAALEDRWSRFRGDSEITSLNRAGGEWLEVSDDTVTLLEVMRSAIETTSSAFDPTVLPALLDAGYTHSVVDGSPAPELPIHDPAAAGLGGEVLSIDHARRLVRLEPGTAIDPGGIGKGLAADLLAVELLDLGADAVLVSIGGDLRTAGTPPSGSWTIRVERPDDPAQEILTLALDTGGIATSTTSARRFQHDGRSTHHVIDPRTGAPATSDLISATVVAPTAWQAEALATAALVLGAAQAYALLSSHLASGVLLTSRGACLVTPDLTRPGTAVAT